RRAGVCRTVKPPPAPQPSHPTKPPDRYRAIPSRRGVARRAGVCRTVTPPPAPRKPALATRCFPVLISYQSSLKLLPDFYKNFRQ
ncbi:MAG: hypothetical protein IKR79_05305, partial [Bacteroidales bacterium]|nr:hypothetical protein [Bacteroidales bacterium]